MGAHGTGNFIGCLSGLTKIAWRAFINGDNATQNRGGSCGALRARRTLSTIFHAHCACPTVVSILWAADTFSRAAAVLICTFGAICLLEVASALAVPTNGAFGAVVFACCTEVLVEAAWRTIKGAKCLTSQRIIFSRVAIRAGLVAYGSLDSTLGPSWALAAATLST